MQNDPKSNLAISFALPVEVMGMVIVSAKIGFYCWTVSGWVEDQYLDLYRITEHWEEGSGAGNGDIDWATPGGTIDPELRGGVYFASFKSLKTEQSLKTLLTP